MRVSVSLIVTCKKRLQLLELDLHAVLGVDPRVLDVDGLTGVVVAGGGHNDTGGSWERQI